jgi:hypothetical protein
MIPQPNNPSCPNGLRSLTHLWARAPRSHYTSSISPNQPIARMDPDAAGPSRILPVVNAVPVFEIGSSEIGGGVRVVGPAREHRTRAARRVHPFRFFVPLQVGGERAANWQPCMVTGEEPYTLSRAEQVPDPSCARGAEANQVGRARLKGRPCQSNR